MKAWIKQLLSRELSSHSVWAITFSVVAVLILTRLVPLSENYLYYDDFAYDDFAILPWAHLKDHRFVLAAEQSFWYWVYGPDYLRSYVPKIASLCYITLGVWAMLRIFLAWQVPFVTALSAVLLFLAHPILTDYSVWNIMSPSNLAWSFCLLGYLAQLRPGRYALAAGISLAFLGLGAYQIVVGLFAMLVLIEALLRLISGDLDAMPWKRRLIWVLFSIALYIGYLLLVSSWLLDHPTTVAAGGARGFPKLSEIFTFSFLQQKYQSISNGYLIVFQPILGFYFGTEAAWRGAWLSWLLIGLPIPAVLYFCWSARIAFIGFVLLVAALLAPMAFHLVVSTPAFGWRVSLGALLALSFAFVVTSVMLLARSNLWPLAGLTSLAGLATALAFVPVTLKDAENRARGYIATKELVHFLSTTQRRVGAEHAGAISIGLQAPVSSTLDASGEVMINFQISSCTTYSAASYQRHFGKVLRWGGVQPAPNDGKLPSEVRTRINTLCERAAPEQRCGITGIVDKLSGLSVACFYGGGW